MGKYRVQRGDGSIRTFESRGDIGSYYAQILKDGSLEMRAYRAPGAKPGHPTCYAEVIYAPGHWRTVEYIE